MNSRNGFTLLELLIMITILTIILSIGVPNLTAYIRKYKAENEITSLYSVLTNQRFKSMNTGIPHGVYFDNYKKYTIFTFNDVNYNLKFDGVSEEKDKKSVDLKYALSNPAPGAVILFDENGMARNKNWALGNFTIYLNIPARYNCIAVSTSRIAMGEWDGNRCKVK